MQGTNGTSRVRDVGAVNSLRHPDFGRGIREQVKGQRSSGIPTDMEQRK